MISLDYFSWHKWHLSGCSARKEDSPFIPVRSTRWCLFLIWNILYVSCEARGCVQYFNAVLLNAVTILLGMLSDCWSFNTFKLAAFCSLIGPSLRCLLLKLIMFWFFKYFCNPSLEWTILFYWWAVAMVYFMFTLCCGCGQDSRSSTRRVGLIHRNFWLYWRCLLEELLQK